MTTETDLLQEAVALLRNLMRIGLIDNAVIGLDRGFGTKHPDGVAITEARAFLAKIDAMPAKMSGCPKCGKPEIDAMTPLTVYACESSDFDQRPGTFKQSKTCAAMLAASQRHGGG